MMTGYEIAQDAINTLESAEKDIQDCDHAIDTASQELDNVRSNIEGAMSVLEDIRDDDGSVENLERDITILKAKLEAAEGIIDRQKEALDEINTIALDELTKRHDTVVLPRG